MFWLVLVIFALHVTNAESIYSHGVMVNGGNSIIYEFHLLCWSEGGARSPMMHLLAAAACTGLLCAQDWLDKILAQCQTLEFEDAYECVHRRWNLNGWDFSVCERIHTHCRIETFDIGLEFSHNAFNNGEYRYCHCVANVLCLGLLYYISINQSINQY